MPPITTGPGAKPEPREADLVAPPAATIASMAAETAASHLTLRLASDMEQGHHVTDHMQRLIRLKLWHAASVCDAGELPFADAIRHRTGIFRLTTFAGVAEREIAEDRQGWAETLSCLEDVRKSAADTEEFEHRGLRLLWPLAEPMVEVELARFAEFCSTADGPFKFEISRYYADNHAPEHVTLHVRNCYRPDSPFDHHSEIKEALRKVLDRAAEVRRDVTWIQCGSWLNSLPPFARLFPQSWVDTAVPGKPGGHMGWWGQFQDRRGGFHEANARRFRATGKFPYTHLLCHCPIEDLRRHLDEE